MEEVPEQENIRVVDRLGIEEVVRLDRDLAILDRLWIMLVPVLRLRRHYVHSSIETREVLTATA